MNGRVTDSLNHYRFDAINIGKDKNGFDNEDGDDH